MCLRFQVKYKRWIKQQYSSSPNFAMSYQYYLRIISICFSYDSEHNPYDHCAFIYRLRVPAVCYGHHQVALPNGCRNMLQKKDKCTVIKVLRPQP